MIESEHNVSLDLVLCQECGGRCCKGSPGIWIDPDRFFALFFPRQKVTLDHLRERLPSLGLVLWENSGVPISAPRSLSSGCSFIGADGYQLSITARPCQCLALNPDKATLDLQEGCRCHFPANYSREKGRQRWQDYWQASSML
jgi:hypothetical protein